VSVATSPAFPGRPIGRANGLDLPFPGHFAKKILGLYRNQPAVQPLLLENFAKKPSTFSGINPQSNVLSVLFVKKTSNFSEIQPAIQAFLGWLATRSVGLSGPNSAPCLSYLLFFFNYE